MNLLFLQLTSALILTSDAKVSLNSSAVKACPGTELVFTCTTDTGKLVWRSGGDNHLYTSGQYSDGLLDNLFILKLTNVTGMILISTATVQNVLLDYNGRTISCSDSFNTGTGALMDKTIQIAGPPSSPLNLTFTSSSTPYLVTISWVAPLDTPLCVDSYTVTVRNSCNSSQVMVYNTFDNRSSLSITDLTSDGEYSVTVAGRDGAGQLRQKSEELRISLKVPQIVLLGYVVHSNSVVLNWKLEEQLCFPLVYYLITHNVSSDQSPITVNRTNVTLYGIQPGEIYTVKISPYVLLKAGKAKKFTFTIHRSHYNVSNIILSVHTVSSLKPTLSTVTYSATINNIGTGTTVNTHQTVQVWMVVMLVVPWVLLAVVVTISCSIIIGMRVNFRRLELQKNEDVVKCSTSKKLSSNEMKLSCEGIVPYQPNKPNENKGVGEGEIYEEVNSFVETLISMKPNIAYTAVKHTSAL